MNKLLIVALVLLALGAGYVLSSGNDNASRPTSETQNEQTASAGSTLDLSGKQLTTLPDTALDGAASVKELDLSNNQLESLPASITKFENLEVLKLENNRLTSLPPEIGQLTKLRILDLGNNRLEQLPSELANLSQLTELKLNGYKGPSGDIDAISNKLPNTQVQT